MGFQAQNDPHDTRQPENGRAVIDTIGSETQFEHRLVKKYAISSCGESAPPETRGQWCNVVCVKRRAFPRLRPPHAHDPHPRSHGGHTLQRVYA